MTCEQRLELALAALEGFMGWAAERDEAIEAREQAYQREVERVRHIQRKGRAAA